LNKHLQPKIFKVFQEGYSKKTFFADLTAGIIVGVVALPLAIAFAIASGVKPEQGLFTAIIAGIIVSLLGGSRVQIAGPTGAFIVIVYGIVQRYGYDGLAVATFLAGIILVIMGFARFGTLLKFIPYPLTVGFTSGIAVIIFSSQVNDFLGLHIQNLPADFVQKWVTYAGHFSSFDYYTLGISIVSLLIIVFWQRITQRIPGSLVAIILGTAAVQIFQLPVETIGSRFGDVPTTLPAPHFPKVSWDVFTQMFSPALTIALLAAIESLLSAVVSDGMIRSRHRSNAELIGTGVANIVSPLFLGIPATGAIARTATNVKNGGKSPIAGVIHSITLLLIMLVFGQWAKLIPMGTLAAVLVVVAYNMSEWRSFAHILKSPKGDITVMLVTFLLTIIVDLTIAIQIGVLLSALFFIRRMSEVSQVTPLTRDLKEEEDDAAEGESPLVVPNGVEVFEVFGSLFFGAVDQFTESLHEMKSKPKVFILETKNLLAIDATGLRALESLTDDLHRQGSQFLLAGIHKQPLFAMQQSGFLDKIGEDNVFSSLSDALEQSRVLVEKKK
jgi:sulfate permease, SulP family